MPEWKHSTIRPKPNTLYMYEKPDHRLGYLKRESMATGRIQYLPRCFGCKWKSTVWYKSRNDASRREFIAHVKSVPAQEVLPGIPITS